MARQCATATVYGPGGEPENGNGDNNDKSIVDTIRDNPAVIAGGLGIGALAVIASTGDDEER